MNQHLQQQFANRSSQSGFTIIESLLALLVVAALMVAISPVLVLATANRVQAKRVELATNAAKAYIDGVRAGTIPTPPISNTPLTSIGAPSAGRFSCPTANAYCTLPRTSFYQVFCIDGNGDGKCTPEQFKDMIVQASGYQPTNTTPPPTTPFTPDPTKSFQLSIRVYRADAFLDSGALKASSSNLRRGTTKAQTSIVTGGLGDRKAPQIEMQTEIVTAKPSYSDYCTRLGGCN